MSILIKGIDAKLIEKDACAIINTGTALIFVQPDRIIPIPDHGDLIDRDELMKHGVYMPREGGNLPLVYMSYVKSEKAVIPAERSEE